MKYQNSETSPKGPRFSVIGLVRGNSRAFTLVETLIAVSIFSAALVAMVVVTAGGVSNVSYVKSKLTATFLAQEALEIVHNDRDSSIVSGKEDWAAFTARINQECGATSSGCNVEFDRTNASAPVFTYKKCTGCKPLKISNAGFYGYKNNDALSPYTRTLKTIIQPIPGTSDTAFGLSVTVAWLQGSAQKSITITEVLMNWVPEAVTGGL